LLSVLQVALAEHQFPGFLSFPVAAADPCLSDASGDRVRSCVRPVDALHVTAGLEKVRVRGPNQTTKM
jgi:hypothetical protein